jgi:hypothetical protein
VPIIATPDERNDRRPAGGRTRTRERRSGNSASAETTDAAPHGGE